MSTGTDVTGTVMITTGGTGGHIFPGLAVAAKLLARGWRVFWLGTREGMEAKLVPQHGVAFEGVAFGGLRGKGLRQLVLGPFALAGACWQSRGIIRRHAPDVVLGFGGFASFPGALMGVAAAKPLVLHEQNAIAGLANRVLAYGADRVLTGFPSAFAGRLSGKVDWVGNPVRDAFAHVPAPEVRFAGRAGPLALLVVGGSLGAAGLNERVPKALALIPHATRPRVVHQAGERHVEALRAAYREVGVDAECIAFIDDIAARYAEADLVVCRGGATTVAELAAVGVGAIIIPLPGAIADEQSANARFLVDAGAAVSVLQSELTPGELAVRIEGYTRKSLLAMAVAARKLARPDAAERVADACIALGIAAMRHTVKRVHFVGIGGAGMSGIAEVLATQGYQVSGSDLAASAATRRLVSLGAKIAIGHNAAHVAGADAVVVSTAVPADNPEIAAARESGIPVVPRALMLAELMRLKTGIAVAGTHGKTTTTSLIASVLAEGDLDPTFVIGGRLLAADAHARLGKGDFLVAEADESDASFLYLAPALAVVTNIDADHMETYDHDFGRLKRAFVDFALRLPFYGVAVLCIDDDNVRDIMPQIAKRIVTYGLAEDARLRAVGVTNAAGRMRFVARSAQAPDLPVELNLPGVHNVRNALAAIAIGREVGVADAAIAKALAEFHGVGRRFQRWGDVALPDGGTFTLIDDYGHHPKEMAATIEAVRGSFPGRRLVLAFQPHRYTRTRDLFEDFVAALSTVDALVLTDVYPAGEPPIVAADGRALARAVRVAGQVEPVFAEKLADVAPAISAIVRAGDVVVTMGAGSIGQVPSQLSSS